MELSITPPKVINLCAPIFGTSSRKKYFDARLKTTIGMWLP
jgi:hypothetical protein